jgi:FkbM family methyltransferase
MKKILKKFINKLGYEIKKVDKEFKNISIEDLLKKTINQEPTIFDVGSNRGQSIDKFKKIFKEPHIHSFEPNKYEFNFMQQKYKNDRNLILNNFAFGEFPGEKIFNITANTGNSSFNEINKDTRWLKVRSKEQKTSVQNFVKKAKVKISTLDEYCYRNKIDKIDLLKIDTQGYEDKVLKGSLKTLEQKKVKAILTEIIFDNVYDKYFSFSDIEKFLLPNNFRMVGIYLYSNSLFDNLTFFADVIYLNKNYYDL